MLYSTPLCCEDLWVSRPKTKRPGKQIPGSPRMEKAGSSVSSEERSRAEDTEGPSTEKVERNIVEWLCFRALYWFKA